MLYLLLLIGGHSIICSDIQERFIPCIFKNSTDSIIFLAKPKEHVSRKYEMREIDFSLSAVLAPQQEYDCQLMLHTCDNFGKGICKSEPLIIGHIINHQLENALHHEFCFNKTPTKINAFIQWNNTSKFSPLTIDIKHAGLNSAYLGSGQQPFRNIESFKKHD